MAVKIQEPEISTRQALQNIRERLYKAVEEGKKKAGILTKTEAVLEGTGNPASSDDDELDFSQMVPENGNDNELDFSQMTTETGLGDELDFSQMTSDKETGVEGAPKLPKTFAKKTTGLTRAEKLASERRSQELKSQKNAEWTYSVKEIKEYMKDLFKYASDNREYLKDAGPLITEPELRSIFHAEFKNYGSDTLKDTTKATLKIVGDNFDNQVPWLLTKFNERLHGEGSFLENGSLMGYLYRIASRRLLKTIAPRPMDTLTVGGEEGLCNFILVDDFNKCLTWVKDETKGYDLPLSAKNKLALDILANGMSKDEMKKKLGGTGSKEYSNPKFGSLERIGDDVCVLGTELFLKKFISLFAAFLKRNDVTEIVRPDIEPAVKANGGEYGRGIYMVRYPEVPYLNLINDAIRRGDEDHSGILIPITFGAGSTSFEGDNTESGDGTRRSDVLQTHQIKDTVDSNDYSVGELKSIDNMMQSVDKPAFVKLVNRVGLDELYKEVIGGGNVTIAGLSKLVSSVIEKVCKELGVDTESKVTQTIRTVKVGTDKSLSDMAVKEMGLTPPEGTALLNAVRFNGFMIDRVANIESGHDVGDLKDMNKYELRSAAMPVIFTSKLGEVCLSGKLYNPDAVEYAKGYLINALGTVVGFDESDAQIFGSTAEVCSVLGIPNIAGSVIKAEVKSLGADELPAYAIRFEEAGARNVDDEDDENANAFYKEGANVELAELSKCGIAKAIDEISARKNSGADIIKRAAEAAAGFDAGFLNRYMNALANGDNEAVEEMAREIMRSGKGIVSVQLTDTGSEKVKRNTAVSKRKADAAERRKTRRAMWR